MKVARRPDSASQWERLLRRACVIVRHHRYHRQPVEARDVVDRVLRHAGDENIVQYRGALEEAVRSLIHDLR